MNYLIGIDASTVNTGLSVFGKDDGPYSYIGRTLVSAPAAAYKKDNMTKKAYAQKKHEHMQMRVEFMIIGILDCLEKYHPKTVVMEDVYAGNDYHTMKMLARIQGAVQGWCITNECRLIFKAPSVWRRELSIKTVVDGIRLKSSALKASAVRYISEKYHIDVTDDEAESICIALSEIKKIEKQQDDK